MTKVENAIIFATIAHTNMYRKGTSIPYICHPLEALAIASSMTTNEDVLCVTVLHDTIEDASITKEQLEKEFGSNVANMVLACSEDKMEKHWHARKQKAIDSHLNASRDVQMVLLSDKLSNMRSLMRDYMLLGNNLWERFNEKNPFLQLWYYESFLESCYSLRKENAYVEYENIFTRLKNNVKRDYHGLELISVF